MNYRRAVITGASSGIGLACAQHLAAEGVHLLLLARRGERLQQLKLELAERHNVEVRLATVDVRDRSQIKKMTVEHEAFLRQTDILVNNAGLAKGTQKLQDGVFADWDEMIETNVKGLLNMARTIIPYMVNNQSGHIVNIGSVAGRWVYPGGAVYCATKFATRALSEGMRMDLSGTPLRVTNIEPGMAETEFSQVRFQNVERAKAIYQGMQPLQADDIAETVVWCLKRPAHVNIRELVIFPTAQAAIQLVHRRDDVVAKPI